MKSVGAFEALQTYEYRFILFVMSLAVLFGSFFAALAFHSGDYQNASVFFGLTLAAALGVCIQLLIGLSLAVRAFYTGCILIAFFYLVVDGGADGSGLFTCLAVTPALVSLLGFRLGSMLLGAMIPVLAGLFYFDVYLDPQRAFAPLAEIKFLANFIGLSLFAIGLDYFRHRMQATMVSLNRSIHEVAHRDQLTGLANRREMDERLQQLWREYRQSGALFSVILCDVDDFKSFNDQYGHDFGDRIIVKVGQRLQYALRGNDLVARWGGDEFLVLLPGQNSRSAALIGERLRRRIAETSLTSKGQEVHLTISAGVACADSVTELADLLKQADAGLYQAKNMGKDRLVIA